LYLSKKYGEGSLLLKKWGKIYRFLAVSACHLGIFGMNCMSKVDNLSNTVDKLQEMVEKNAKTGDKNQKTGDNP
jgi:hypothetical protein